jgi:DNA modification methylase
MKIEQIPTDKLIPYARNAKRHDAAQVSKLAGSIREFGFNNPVLIDKDNGIVAGHGRVMAAQKLELKTVPCIRLGHLTDTQRRAYILADNRLAEVNSGWDEELLKLEIKDIDWGELKEISIDDFQFGEIDFGEEEEEPVSDADAEPQIDKAEELRAKWGVEPGQLWELGDHRLLCGDSTKKEDVDRVMGGERAACCCTDPPYGMNLDTDWSDAVGSMGSIGQKNKTAGNKYAPVIGDDAPFDPSPIFDLWSAKEMFLFGADYYAEHIPSRTDGSWLCWDKRKDTQADAIGAEFELCWSKQKHKRRMLRHDWFGFLSSANASEARNRQHPTQKPTSLICDILTQWTQGGCIVSDPYCGSGTTIIACEQLGRKCRAIEISPAYVAVALQRWADATGKTPRKL